MRFKAIWYALKHGLLPWWAYEKEKHYSCSYLQHLLINIKYAWRWATFSEYQSDIDFETLTNKNNMSNKIKPKTQIVAGDWYSNENGDIVTILAVTEGWCMARQEGVEEPFIVPEEFVLGTFNP